MIDRTAAQRQARKLIREQVSGLVRRTVTIPKDRQVELATIVRMWRTLHDNRPAENEETS
jgi:hypothetical protein